MTLLGCSTVNMTKAAKVALIDVAELLMRNTAQRHTNEETNSEKRVSWLFAACDHSQTLTRYA